MCVTDGPPDQIESLFERLEDPREALETLSRVTPNEAGWLAHYIRDRAEKDRELIGEEISQELAVFMICFSVLHIWMLIVYAEPLSTSGRTKLQDANCSRCMHPPTSCESRSTSDGLGCVESFAFRRGYSWLFRSWTSFSREYVAFIVTFMMLNVSWRWRTLCLLRKVLGWVANQVQKCISAHDKILGGRRWSLKFRSYLDCLAGRQGIKWLY